MKHMRKLLMQTLFCFSKDIFIGCTVFPVFLLTQDTMFMKLLNQSDDFYMIPFAYNTRAARLHIGSRLMFMLF